ncbi:hypothetical protein P153DRAFT_355177 [Dothidotthia symphoricarpi CBS 119687]|uniref:F-box domain-containing protein n=1 Tax=Dothidotthia symphoricarpi CBS 119687 TaxID=1392245 RepID=A0A6A6AJT7_9PLEO|nr:uncharacterized protein P153DRAFT_355177 [Dothidotthia symphoricarpi CBS 119687]KAF2131378.1 hypothetical protein P153DRAFT_355177 [Dothidotthia symphoricarpi CBS 119687]
MGGELDGCGGRLRGRAGDGVKAGRWHGFAVEPGSDCCTCTAVMCQALASGSFVTSTAITSDTNVDTNVDAAAQCLRRLRRPRTVGMDDQRARPGNVAQHAPANAPRAQVANPTASKVQQPTPQALPSRSGPSSILVSPRQKGNPILNGVKSVAWEYSDIPADYVVGATTCALFLSLKYHRLHPEYIYNRIRDLKGQYNLRILLTMVDIENHEESLRELSKTSLVNNVTVMLCWSAQEAGRYLELFKTFENAAPTSIRAQQSSTYSEKMVEFITVPRSINKTDAVGLVSNFGSVRTAISAGPEEIGLIAGWGDKKVQRWCNAVREPFRVKKAARRSLNREDSRPAASMEISMAEEEDLPPTETAVAATARQRLDDAVPLAMDMQRASLGAAAESDADKRPDRRPAEDLDNLIVGDDEEEAMRDIETGRVGVSSGSQIIASKPAKRKQIEEDMSEGVMAALNKLRKQYLLRFCVEMAFNLLPVELHIEIFTYLPASDLKNVRRVCKKFWDTASPTLFRSIVACARYKALGAFQNISLHSIYPKYVKEIVFDSSLYNKSMAKQERMYAHAVARIEGHQPGPPSWFGQTRWKRYQELFTDQQEMVTSGVLIQTIARALDQLPHVTSIVYSPHPHFIPIEAKVVRDLLPRGIGPTSRYMPEGLARSSYDYASSSHAFRQLIGAIYLSQYTGVRKFKVDRMRTGEPGTEFSISIFDLPTADDEQAALHLFSRLQHLELNMAFYTETRGCSLSVVSKNLAKRANLLIAAQDLKYLAIHITHWKKAALHMYDSSLLQHQVFACLGLRTTWPKLQSLSLEGIYAEERDFSELLKRHSGTLKSVTFRQCSLFKGVWADIVDEVVYNSKIFPFVLDLVNETNLPGEDWMSLGDADRESWRYEGHLIQAEDGDRTFIENAANKKSVYDSRK